MANMRIGGLASGMDIDTIVGDLMKAERIPLDKLVQNKQTFEWQRDSYRDINKKLADFDKYLVDNFVISSNFNKKIVTSSNSAVATATAKSNALDGTMTLHSVSNIAKSAAGASDTALGQDITSSSTLAELGMTTNAEGKVELSLDVYDETSDTKYKTHTFTFDSSEKLSDVIKKINSSSAGVTMFFDEQSKKVSIATTKTGGSPDDFEIKENDTDFFAKLGFSSKNLADGGENAIFNMNGLEMERSGNTFEINGLTFTLKAESTTPVTFTSTTDVDSMVTKVEEFVNKYNDLISSLNDTIKEKRYRDYPPLTEEQKKDMSEKEIELWEEKAKSGLLRSDSIISNGLSEMRRGLYSRVDGIGEDVIDTLSEFGITTSNVISENGKLVIDTDKLRTALESDPEKVVQTLTQSGNITKDANGQVTSDTRGIVQRLRNTMTDMTKNIETKAGKATHTNNQFSLGRQLDDVENRITDFQRRLEDIEARYWRQFTAMEQAIQKANQQSAFIMEQFGG
ncbi:flagellar hook-associated protein 2 [Robertmurraya massiliosenegalensis]|uniref:flagellar hook-associated protein 2 n=1 Tax=Robertmurraya massiliosenegalensis TaxID=1287657 RepID=UPI0002DD78E7|nr:flagellar hook-associated protein 2 [Robertmurraya massiliosenegalensis]